MPNLISFSSTDQIDHFLRNMQTKMVPMTPAINFAIRYSKHYNGIDPISVVRSLCGPDVTTGVFDDLNQVLIVEARRAYVNFIGWSDLSAEGIDQRLNDLMPQNVPPYIYPFPKSKMYEVLFAGLSSALAEKVFNVLSAHPQRQLFASRSYITYTPADLTPQQYEQLIAPLSLKSLDLNQLVQDVYAEISEYQQRVAELETANEILLTTVSQLTQQVNQNALTRWY